MTEDNILAVVLAGGKSERFGSNKSEIIIKDSDRDYLDAWDHIVAKLVVQNQRDDTFGIPFEDGPINDRIYQDNSKTNLGVHFST